MAQGHPKSWSYHIHYVRRGSVKVIEDRCRLQWWQRQKKTMIHAKSPDSARPGTPSR